MLIDILSYVFVFLFMILAYVGIHMAFEKDAKKSLPLIWERGGLLHKLIYPENKIFDKSKIKYRDGDNT